uniref:Uncharacterized protein n=1 Tax=Arundo donax TaxID=35708 RepID=A0A0A9F6T1_ARUDO
MFFLASSMLPRTVASVLR